MDKITIHCGDHTIELTPEELRSAYEYKEREYLIEDIESCIEELELTEDETETVREAFNVIAERAMIYLDKSDGYWDHYWLNVEDAIKDVLKESINKI